MCRLIVFAWEYYGYHSKGGTALSRRVAQVANSFLDNGWSVTVVHKDQIGESGNNSYYIEEKGTFKRISVKQQHNTDPSSIANPFVRKIQTAYYVLFKGDRSHQWTNDVLAIQDVILSNKPDLIISFYTPRGPLTLGSVFSQITSTPWIADLQDELKEGLSTQMISLSRMWAEKILKSAAAVVQVSPEWAEQDSIFCGRKVSCIRHAIPVVNSLTPSKQNSDYFDIFYGGSLHKGSQSLHILVEVFKQLKLKNLTSKIRLVLASNSDTVSTISECLSPYVTIKSMGWLSQDEYLTVIAQCNCFLVVPWSSLPRKVIPSKFYELCAWDLPIWVVGEDTGAFEILMREWEHPLLESNNIEKQTKLIEDILNGVDNKLFRISNCKGNPLYTSSLFDSYQQLLNK